jgi:hypothetical protein
MLYVLGAEDADDVFLQKQIEYLNKLLQEGKELEKQVAEVKKKRQAEAETKKKICIKNIHIY